MISRLDVGCVRPREERVGLRPAVAVDGTQRVFAINAESDIVAPRQEARTMAQRLGLSPLDQARVTTAVSELSRNIVVYGVRGTVALRLVQAGGRAGIEMSFDDDGPGIEDINRAMTQGFSTGRGLGAGLPGSKRLMDEFEIASQPGQGVHIRCRKWR